MCVNKEISIDYQVHSKTIDHGGQQAALLGGHHSGTSRYLVSHMAEMHGKQPMTVCISDSACYVDIILG